MKLILGIHEKYLYISISIIVRNTYIFASRYTRFKAALNIMHRNKYYLINIQFRL